MTTPEHRRELLTNALIESGMRPQDIPELYQRVTRFMSKLFDDPVIIGDSGAGIPDLIAYLGRDEDFRQHWPMGKPYARRVAPPPEEPEPKRIPKSERIEYQPERVNSEPGYFAQVRELKRQGAELYVDDTPVDQGLQPGLFVDDSGRRWWHVHVNDITGDLQNRQAHLDAAAKANATLRRIK